MTNTEIVNRRLQEEALKDRMIVDCIIILATCEYIQNRIEEKLLEIDALENEYSIDEVSVIRTQVYELLAKLHREEQRMDEFMAKYKVLVHEKEALLSHSRKGKPVYLRGVPPHPRWPSQSSEIPNPPKKTSQDAVRR